MKGRIFLSGSIAYDYLMQFDGFFNKVILKEHLNHLNIAFIGKNKVMHFGGCGTNIGYTLKMLDESPLIYGVAGKDFNEYNKWLKSNHIDTSYIGIDPDNFTASAYILTDKKENQITFFAPGAMKSFKYEKKLLKKDLKSIKLAILSPDICERTVRLAKMLISAQIPYFFDPGQVIHVYSLKDLKFLLKNAYGLIANHYEVKLLCKRLGLKVNDITKHVDIFVETLGAKGSILRMNGEKIKIPVCKPKRLLDPTGCGDAFRAGLLAGLSKGYDPIKACKMGALTSAYVIENTGTQKHSFSMKEFSERYKKNFK
jgi:adenosine kinase